ncbi:MAG: DNA cytosine methyltransferase [Alloprevotella sp.]|nr:DNA cytosine methyltransferase [Alloprevotella sp.]
MSKPRSLVSDNIKLLDVVKRNVDERVKGVFDDSCLCEDGHVLSFNEQVAIVTHYLQLSNDESYGKSYKQKASSLLKLWYDFVNGTPKEDNRKDCVCEDIFYSSLFNEIISAPFSGPSSHSFTFIDLFAGIGGFRIAMQDCGGKCVYSSEWDENAQKTYYYNFGEVPFGDITREYTKGLIPDGFDVLCAGFPCQAFSVAGYRRGFEDTRGTLFFDVAEIIRRKRPKAVYLENVKNLYTHDNGRTFEVIKTTLEELGYVVFHKVMNAMEYANVPQNRERIFIVCFDPKQVRNYSRFAFPEKEPLVSTIHSCIDYSVKDKKFFYGDKMGHIEEIRAGVVSKDTIYQWRRQYVRENKSKVCPTLTANMGTGGHNVPLILTDDGIRKLTPKECLNFQGFPINYSFPTSMADSAKYKQAGNSVVVPLIKKVCKNIVTTILENS